MSGRFAPSPTGALHLGNLRTAAIAWLSARAQGLDFIVRMEDLDRHQSDRANEIAQLADLAAIGIDWDGPVVRQSERFDLYDDAIDRLRAEGRVYECYCTRAEIRRDIEASSRAPHGPPGSYPGTCRDLDDAARAERRSSGRPPAVRLRSDGTARRVVDAFVGDWSGAVDDVVLRRNDGVPAYNLAVVVDDAAQGVTEVVRGDDLLPSTPRQMYLQERLRLATPRYVHVPLVMGPDGARLSKSHGATTLAELGAVGVSPADVVGWIARTLGIDVGAAPSDAPTTVTELLETFRLDRIGGDPVDAPDWIGRSAAEQTKN